MGVASLLFGDDLQKGILGGGQPDIVLNVVVLLMALLDVSASTPEILDSRNIAKRN